MGRKRFKEKKYLESCGNICPYCGGDDLNTGNIQTDSGSAWQDVDCENCGSEWRDLYTLTEVEEIHNNT
jgi:hypothetical protein